MRLLPELFDHLVESLRLLPGVGPRSAQRMALQLLERDKRDHARAMAKAIVDAVDQIQHCENCRNYTDRVLCEVCTNTGRNDAQLCIVETPADLIAIESISSFHGQYFVLMGKLSPLDGIGPSDLGFDHLFSRVATHPPEEIILALSATVEGEATSYYLNERLTGKVKSISRIAQGIPTGGNLEYLDARTLTHAFNDRKSLLESAC